jgi:F-type H+-transporting ATPase subunit b
MLHDPTFWVAVAFVIFVAAVGRKIAGAMSGALDKRSEAIGKEIVEAEKLREEAQHLLAEYKRKQRDALNEAEEILNHAKVEAKRLAAQAEQDLEAALKRREQAAMEKISQAEAKALQEVRNQAVDVALRATARLLEANLDQNRGNALVEKSIRDLSDKLN